MARFQLNQRELGLIRARIAMALSGECIPDWEFEALVGSSRGRTRRSLEAALRRIELRGERPSDLACERLILLVSASLGASPEDADELESLLRRLASDERSPLQSGVAVRVELAPPARRVRLGQR